jgi:hypothetical protein
MGVVNEQSNTYMVYIGVDIGQSQDPTAIVVADPEIRENEIHYVIRYLRRLPLGISYPAIIEEIIKVHQNIPEPDGSFELNKQVWIDATGVGKPVVDLIRNNCSYINLHEVYIIGGEAKDNINPWSRVIKLPKAYLVSRLQVMLGYGRIHLPKTEEASALQEELKNYTIRVNEHANSEFGAFKVGTHDDLVTALGLACLSEYIPIIPKAIAIIL